MSTAFIRRRYSYKNYIFMALLASSRGVSSIPSRNKKPGPFAPTFTLPSFVTKIAPRSTPAALQVPKYNKNDLQRIFRAILKARLFVAQRNFDKLREQTLKP